jgi:hypothetical protein
MYCFKTEEMDENCAEIDCFKLFIMNVDCEIAAVGRIINRLSTLSFAIITKFNSLI